MGQKPQRASEGHLKCFSGPQMTLLWSAVSLRCRKSCFSTALAKVFSAKARHHCILDHIHGGIGSEVEHRAMVTAAVEHFLVKFLQPYALPSKVTSKSS